MTDLKNVFFVDALYRFADADSACPLIVTPHQPDESTRLIPYSSGTDKIKTKRMPFHKFIPYIRDIHEKETRRSVPDGRQPTNLQENTSNQRIMINTLTSLRFIFALMVFGSHCYTIDPFFDAHFFKEGFVGVSFFFVLSGFIIAYNYQKKFTEKKTDKRTFGVARIARIYPLHWLTLFIAAILGGYVIASGPADWCKHFFASLTLTNAYIPHSDYFFSFNSPSWSLCCEQLFYICFPFLIPLTQNYKKLLYSFLFCAVLVVVGMYFTPAENIKEYWYVNPVTRFPDFLVGMLLFQLYNHLKTKNITFRQGNILEILSIVLFLGFYLYADTLPKVYRYSCYYWLPVALVLISFSLQKGVVSRILSNRYLVIGGEISYSFYLIHLFVLLPYAAWQKNSHWHISPYISIPLLFCIVVLLSLVSYYYFEKPMNKLVKKLVNK